MGREVVLFESEERTDRAHVCAFLRELADNIEANSVVLKQGAEETPVDIPDSITLEVKLEEETGSSGLERSLEVELEWRVGDQAGAGGVSLG
ncbi:MAG TPA: amphi-Trp domain-containing protein [Armatimonadetes bacterium]|nr:amphi-Trp domain-containing protein [Armatimonadota bacterium]